MIQLEGSLADTGAPPHVLAVADKFEGFVIDLLGITGEIYLESQGVRYVISVDQTYASGKEVITKIREVDL